MPCFHPIKGFRAPGGEIKFSRSGAYRDLPLTVACGQCSGCRLERSRQWAVRCLHEAQMHNSNSFLTLTYDHAHLPTDLSLDVTHWQQFAKRLRSSHGQFRFYHCGEYGDLNGRPHYHAAIFGLDFHEDRKPYRKTKADHQLYTSAKLDSAWGLGKCFIGNLTFQSAAYVARYIMKKVNGDQAEEHYQRVDESTGEVTQLKPEYTTMSRNKGIGHSWIHKFMSDVYPSDEVIMNGKSSRPPKYYDQQLEKVNPKLWQRVRVHREVAGAKNEDNNTYTRLAIREEVSQARTRTLTRNL